MKDLYDRGEKIDRVTVAEELNRQGQLESVDGLSYLVSLDDGLPEIANLESYLRMVKDKSLLRQTMFACSLRGRTSIRTASFIQDSRNSGLFSPIIEI
jgi:replicative DNA helicase